MGAMWDRSYDDAGTAENSGVGGRLSYKGQHANRSIAGVPSTPKQLNTYQSMEIAMRTYLYKVDHYSKLHWNIG